MLGIFKKLFDDLNENTMSYCIYKSLNHLDEDLDGQRGDIDILLNEKDIKEFDMIALKNNFFKVEKKGKPYYYMGIDSKTHKFVMLDVNTQIQFGPKPNKPYSFFVDVDKLLFRIENENVKVLDFVDYIPLMFIMRVVSLSEKKEDLQELQELIKTIQFDKGYVSNLLEEKIGLKFDDVKNDILNSQNWKVLKAKYIKQVIEKIDINTFLELKQKFKFIFGKFIGLQKKLKVPSYTIRKKGYLVAFVGVDGAGKSSTVDYVRNLEFFKFTGVKRIYFGSNEYWIPGLLYLLKKEFKNRYIRLILSTFTSIDRQLRTVKALYYIYLGNIVLADRYIYDDEIGREQRKTEFEKKSLLKKIYHKIFGVRMLRKPDLTIFLDVSPEVAYSRKQDYSYDTMIKVNKAYKDYMYKVKDVIIINADEKQDKVYKETVNSIISLDRKK